MAYDMTNDEIVEAAARITPQWLAGFFDGEGSVYIQKQASNGCYTVSVCITQSEPKILALVALKFGMKLASTRSVGRQCYAVRLHGRMVVPVLDYIKDHVVCKRRQVFAALEFANTMQLNGRELTQAVIEKRDKLAEVIRSSNHGLDTRIVSESKEGVA